MSVAYGTRSAATYAGQNTVNVQKNLKTYIPANVNLTVNQAIEVQDLENNATKVTETMCRNSTNPGLLAYAVAQGNPQLLRAVVMNKHLPYELFLLAVHHLLNGNHNLYLSARNYRQMFQRACGEGNETLATILVERIYEGAIAKKTFVLNLQSFTGNLFANPNKNAKYIAMVVLRYTQFVTGILVKERYRVEHISLHSLKATIFNENVLQEIYKLQPEIEGMPTSWVLELLSINVD